MANLTRYDPFKLDSVFDDFFKGFVVRPVRGEGLPKISDIKIDVSESDQGYTVKADIPGVKKENIHVAIDGNMVSISAEAKQESEQKEGDKLIHSERYYGQVSRSFSLGSELDEAASQAKYADGVLELTLAKKTAAASKKLTIQ
jgi:HSP20 family protein